MKPWAFGQIPTDRFEDITFRRALCLIRSDGKWKDRNTMWKEHESKMEGPYKKNIQKERNRKGNVMKCNEHKNESRMKDMKGTWRENVTFVEYLLTFDQGCFHTHRKLEKNHISSTESPRPEKTIRDDKSKKAITWFWDIWKDAVFFLQSHISRFKQWKQGFLAVQRARVHYGGLAGYCSVGTVRYGGYMVCTRTRNIMYWLVLNCGTNCLVEKEYISSICFLSISMY